MAIEVAPQAVLWSLLACFSFGVSNFLISYCNEQEGANPWATVGQNWSSCGVLATVPALYLWYKYGTIFYTDEDLRVYQIGGNFSSTLSFTSKALTVGQGLCIGFSLLMIQRAFATDPDSTGPLMAVSSSDIMVVGIACHFLYHEKLSLMQGVAILIVLTGLVVMAAFDSRVGHLIGFFYAIFGMLTFASSLLFMRYTCIEGQAAISRFTGRLFTMLFIGIIALVYAGREGAFKGSKDDGSLYFWPNISGLAQFVGVAALNQAVAYPCTAVVNVIAASNSILGLIFAYMFLGATPGATKLIGMFTVISGVMLITLWKPKKIDGENILNEKLLEAAAGG